MPEQFYVAPASESHARAARLPPPSEDVSHILQPLKIKSSTSTDRDEYVPSAEVDWIVDVTWKDDVPRAATEIAELFRGDHWDELGSATLYGKNADSGRWTYLVSSEAPLQVTALKVAWSYFAPWRQEPPTDASMFDKRLETIDRVVTRWLGAAMRCDTVPETAAKQSHLLSHLYDRLSGEISIQLKSPFLRKFDGKKVWDVMTCLGLQWGDMDCFHWLNNAATGSDRHFTVWTSTHPGYFLPEEIVVGAVKVRDLMFGFTVARSVDPLIIYERMLSAAEYARRRLGGVLLENGRRIDAAETSEKIKRIAAELAACGFSPGSSAALRLF